MDVPSFTSNREYIIAMVLEGGATRASICETLDIKSASLASLFSQIRLMGMYPIEDEHRILSFVDKVTFDNRVAPATTRPTLTPEQAEKRARIVQARTARLVEQYQKAAKQVRKESLTKDKSAEHLAKYKYRLSELDWLLHKVQRNPEAAKILEVQPITDNR